MERVAEEEIERTIERGINLLRDAASLRNDTIGLGLVDELEDAILAGDIERRQTAIKKLLQHTSGGLALER